MYTYHWWPILYIWNKNMDYFLHKSPHYDPFLVNLPLHFTATWMYLWWPILYTYLVRLSYRVIFYGYLCTYLWWPNLYTYLHLVTHSVQLDYFEGLILYTYFPLFDLFSISTTSSRPSLYSSHFMASFVYLLHLAEIIVTYFMSSEHWYPILYGNHLLVTPSVHMKLFNVTPHHDLVCTLVTL